MATSAVQVVSATFQPNPPTTEPASATQPEAQNSALPVLPAPESAQPGPPQTPVTVTQPPGVSGFVPFDYLLMFFGAALIAFLAPVRERYQELRGDPARLEAILEQGATKAQAIARENLALAKERMGFLPRPRG